MHSSNTAYSFKCSLFNIALVSLCTFSSSLHYRRSQGLNLTYYQLESILKIVLSMWKRILILSIVSSCLSTVSACSCTFYFHVKPFGCLTYLWSVDYLRFIRSMARVSFICVLCSLMNLFRFQFYLTAAGVVSCGDRKTSFSTSSAVQITFYFYLLRLVDTFWEIYNFD